MIDKQEELETENLEVELLLEAFYKKYGNDFRDYSRVHIKRRLMNVRDLCGYDSISSMTRDLLWDKKFKQKLLLEFSVNFTEMFRDPDFYLYLREEIMDLLKTFPFVKIWHAGCSTGEEVYSLAIMLKETGLYKKTQVYATDFNDKVLRMAEDGIYPIDYIKTYTSNYQKAGGQLSFSDYYQADNHNVIIEPTLREKIVFANHNLVSDGVFGEMNLILCRNVLIYFNKKLQNRALTLFKDSLCRGGILCLGSKEALRFTDVDEYFESLNEQHRVFRLKYSGSSDDV